MFDQKSFNSSSFLWNDAITIATKWKACIKSITNILGLNYLLFLQGASHFNLFLEDSFNSNNKHNIVYYH
jgi:hypothetical protein